MVKFGKKFFFNEEENSKKSAPKKTKVHNTNKNKVTIGLLYERLKYTVKRFLPLILILILIIIILLSISIVKNNKAKKKPQDNVEDVTNSVVFDSLKISVNTEVPTIEKFVKNYEKNKSDNDTIVYDEKNFEDNKYTSVGEYKVKIILSGKEYTSRLIVVDKDAPIFELQDVTIEEGEYYTINQFIKSCEDNSKKDCAYDYDSAEYGKYNKAGTYDIKIYASDLSGNKSDSKTAKLTIIAKASPNSNPNNQGNNGGSNNKCDYGSADTSSVNPITYSLVKNGCAINPSYARTGTYITIPEKMIKDDLEVLKKDIEKAGIQAKIQFELNVIPVFNTDKTGLVGYSSGIIAKELINKNGKETTGDTVIEYYLNPNGKRLYKINTYKLK